MCSAFHSQCKMFIPINNKSLGKRFDANGHQTLYETPQEESKKEPQPEISAEDMIDK